MTAATNLLVDVDRLRPGMFIQLDLGWMDHPFPRSRFRLADSTQIATLRELGLRRVKVRPDLSDPSAFDETAKVAESTTAAETAAGTVISAPGAANVAGPGGTPGSAASTTAALRPAGANAAVRAAHAAHAASAETTLPHLGSAALPAVPKDPRSLLNAQRDSLARSERLHAQAARAWQGISRDVLQHPTTARDTAQSLAAAMITQLCEDDNTTIRMLSEAAGTAASQHAINVSVLSAMLARALGLGEPELQSVVLGALLHDIGKQLLPDHLRNQAGDNEALFERERREHVAQGLRLGMSMGLDATTLRIIAQHHELRDGSGLPQGLKGEDIVMPARIVALVNLYDRLCNPRHRSIALRTPHEAQALLYAQMRNKLDIEVMSAFVKMLGVYPPGSVVQLSDERMAMVVSVHPMQPLHPSVLVYDPKVAPQDALLLHLSQAPGVSVRRSLHPQHLPRAMLDYLSPRDRVNYYFAHGLAPAEPVQAAA